MISLQRARLSLLAAVGLASALLVLELPMGELLHQRGQLAAVSGQLARLQATNRALAGDVASLRQSSTVAAIAHAEYGLVRPGQRAYAVLASGAGATGAVAPALVQRAVPKVDLVVPAAGFLGSGTAGLAAASADGTSTVGSLWTRALDRLEFWRWAF